MKHSLVLLALASCALSFVAATPFANAADHREPSAAVDEGERSAKKSESKSTQEKKKDGEARYIIRRARGKIEIDGRLNDHAWKRAKKTSAFHFPWWKKGEKEQTSVKLLWDDTHLYVAFVCKDAHIWGEHTKRNSAVYMDDCVELFVAPNRDDPMTYFNLEMNVRGAFLDQYRPSKPRHRAKPWNAEGIRIKVSIDGTLNDDTDRDRSWTLEAAIPLKNYAISGVRLPVKEGDEWRLNLNRCGGKTNSQLSMWSRVRTRRSTFHAPKFFGTVVFSGKK